jgi:hypothetical protein
LEIVDDSDTDAYKEDTSNSNSAEMSDSCGSEEEIVIQTEKIKECKRMCMGISK